MNQTLNKHIESRDKRPKIFICKKCGMKEYPMYGPMTWCKCDKCGIANQCKEIFKDKACNSLKQNGVKNETKV